MMNGNTSRHTQISEERRVALSDEITGIALVSAALLVTSLRVGAGGGLLRSLVEGAVRTVGQGIWAAVLVLTLWGVRKFQGRSILRSHRVAWAWLALFVALLGFFEVFPPHEGQRGGLVGWAVFQAIAYAVGSTSAAIVLFAALSISLMLCLELPASRFVPPLLRSAHRAFLRAARWASVPFLALHGMVARLLGFVHGMVVRLLKDLVTVTEYCLAFVTTAFQTPVASPPVGGLVSPPPASRGPGDDEDDEDDEDEGTDEGDGGDEPDPADDEDLFVREAPKTEAPRATSDAVDDERAAMGWGRGPKRRMQSAVAAALDDESDPFEEEDASADEDMDEDVAFDDDEDLGDDMLDDDEDLDEEDLDDEDMDDEDELGDVPVTKTGGTEGPRIRARRAAGGEQQKIHMKPPLEIFKRRPDDLAGDRRDELEAKGQRIVETLEHFNIKSRVTRITQGPTITQYELKPAAGVKLSKITSLSDDLAMALATQSIRIEAPIPGKSAVGIEVPNDVATPVFFSEMVESPVFKESDSPLLFALGKDVTGEPIVGDMAKMPHLLIAGATGAGKSVCISTIICSLLTRCDPTELRFLMIDPKMVELMIYNGIPHLVSDVVTNPNDANAALKWAVLEMERRYRFLSRFQCRSIANFNKRVRAGQLKDVDPDTGEEREILVPMQYLVIVIDELAELMMIASKEVEEAICRLAQMARAVGIHLIVATQRPSTNVITGIIKANLPSRIAFAVSSRIDSKVILDAQGAEKLLGRGDMLYLPVGRRKAERLQGAFIGDDEVKDLVDFLKRHGEPDYQDILGEVAEATAPQNGTADYADEMLNPCIKLVAEEGEASTSMLQRHFKIGYNRAARIIEAMEQMGVVASHQSGQRRKALIQPGEVEAYLV